MSRQSIHGDEGSSPLLRQRSSVSGSGNHRSRAGHRDDGAGDTVTWRIWRRWDLTCGVRRTGSLLRSWFLCGGVVWRRLIVRGLDAVGSRFCRGWFSRAVFSFEISFVQIFARSVSC
jgi:hypothetical protein